MPLQYVLGIVVFSAMTEAVHELPLQIESLTLRVLFK